jgi:hypothetical protein
VVGVAKATVAIVEVGTDSLLPLEVAGVVGVVDGESLQHSELGLNQVEPTSLGRCPGRMNVQLSEQCLELGMIVNLMEVVEDDEKPPTRIAFAEAAEDIHDFGQPTAWLKYSVQIIAMNVVESQEVLDPVGTTVGCAPTNRAVLFRPGNATHRPDL